MSYPRYLLLALSSLAMASCSVQSKSDRKKSDGGGYYSWQDTSRSQGGTELNDYRRDDFRFNKESFALSGEWLYFKAIEDSIKYAQKTPQNSTLTPTSTPVDQKFRYTSGLRVSLAYKLPKNNWEIGANWMWYETHNPHTHKSTDNHGLLAVLSLPTYALPQNSQVNSVKGSWSLNLNAVNLEFKMPLHISKRFKVTPLGGVKAGFVDQTIKVNYDDFLIVQPTANTPQKIEGRNDMWGVGPMIGVETSFLLSPTFSIFFNGNAAGLCGQFKLKTVYKDLLNVPSNAKLTVHETENRVSFVEQLQAGLEKSWLIGKKNRERVEIEIALGWEVQVWNRQMRLNLFDTLIQPSDGGDLTLSGPFVRGEIRF